MNLTAPERHSPPTTMAQVMSTPMVPRPIVKSFGALTLGVHLRFTLRPSARALTVRVGVLMRRAPSKSAISRRQRHAVRPVSR